MKKNKNNSETNETVEEMKQEIHQEEIKELLKDFKEEENTEEVTVKKSKKFNFLAKIVASILDQTLVIALSVGLLYLFDAIIRLFGYFVVQRQPIFFIIVVIVNVLYAPIIEATKVKTTIGKAILKI